MAISKKNKISTDSMKLYSSRFARNNLPLSASPAWIMKPICLLILSLSLVACTTSQHRSPKTSQEPSTAPRQALPSPAPIIKAQTKDILFAQTALKTLGYKIGFVDGIWGPRSATAIRQFEKQQSIKSADGHLSELNLFTLNKLSGIQRADFAEKQAPPTPTSIAGKVRNSNSINGAPPLIIVDKNYTVHSKPNPYSSPIREIVAGTGLYVIRKVDSQWFEVELDKGKRGYLIDR